jgi:hypothetical protein
MAAPATAARVSERSFNIDCSTSRLMVGVPICGLSIYLKA